MGVYINMEMPTDNTVLIRVFPASENGECYTQQLDIDGDVLAELWSVPVPPHGRLIDADALEVHDGWMNEERELNVQQTHITFVYSNDIANAPTIIPAEEGE